MTKMIKPNSSSLILLLLVVWIFTLSGAETSRKVAKKIPSPDSNESFTFIIFGDRTTGNNAGLEVLKSAVRETNIISPDFVMTVGDLVNGYNGRTKWLSQMQKHRSIMDKLTVPWFPVAGNHDIYWRGKGSPPGGHIQDFKKYYGPVWYAFVHKNSLFVVLFTDEGNQKTGKQTFHKPASQIMSKTQTKWLTELLKKYNNKVKHIFIFQHHPRWQEGEYGKDWNRIHGILKKYKKVSAVFAGHNHRMQYDGKKDGIHYFVLGATGGAIDGDSPREGLLQHYNLVTVRGKKFYVATIPVGTVIDPLTIPQKAVKKGKVLPLLKEEDVSFSAGTSRSIKYPLTIPEVGKNALILEIKVYHSYDDSGDKGMTYKLLASDNKIVKKGYMSSREWFTIEYNKIKHNEKYTFILEDLDTKLSGKYAGNNGEIQINLLY
jgi:calcineurin-like phosphoesterase family protein